MQEIERLSLRFALEAIVRYSLNRIPGVPHRHALRYSRVDGNQQLEPVEIPAPEALAAPLNNIGLQDSTQYSAFLECLRDHPRLEDAIRSPGDVGSPPSSALVLAIRFVMYYIGLVGQSRVFDADAFESAFSLLVRELDGAGWRWIRRTPLHNFSIPQDSPQQVDIAPGLIIRPIGDSERSAWINDGSPDQLKWPALSNVTHLIETAYFRPRHVMQSIAPDVSEDDLLFVLRMLDTDSVSFGITEQRLDSVWNVSVHFPNFRLLPRLADDRLILGGAEQALLKQYFSSYQTLNADSSFQFAKRRYNDGVDRAVEEDRIVDFWIATEALFSDRREHLADLRERLSSRLASFVADDMDLRAQHFAEAFASYKDRSQIVHGSLRRSVRSDDVALIRPLVKASLQRILRAGHLPNVRHLDAK